MTLDIARLRRLFDEAGTWEVQEWSKNNAVTHLKKYALIQSGGARSRQFAMVCSHDDASGMAEMHNASRSILDRLEAVERVVEASRGLRSTIMETRGSSAYHAVKNYDEAMQRLTEIDTKHG